MKKLFLVLTFLIINVLFSGYAFAGVNEPGGASIKGQCAGSFKHYHKKHIEKSLKLIKEKKAVFENTKHYQENWKKYSKSIF